MSAYNNVAKNLNLYSPQAKRSLLQKSSVQINECSRSCETGRDTRKLRPAKFYLNVPSMSDTCKDDYTGIKLARHTCLVTDSCSTSQDGLRDTSSPPTSVDSHSETSLEMDSRPPFRKACRIDILEIENQIDETQHFYSLTDVEHDTVCILEIFAVISEETLDGAIHKGRKDLLCRSQIGKIKTVFDNSGRSTTRVMLPKPFLISAEELFIKKRLNGGVGRYELADQYIAKIWLTAHNSSLWPPSDLISNLDPGGQIIRWLSQGDYTKTHIRLRCKGVLSLEPGCQETFVVELKLGNICVETQYTLRLDVKWTLPPLQNNLGLFSGGLGHEDINTVEGSREIGDSSSPGTLRLYFPPGTDAEDLDMEDGATSEPLRLVVPNTKGAKKSLFHPITRNILQPGQEVCYQDNRAENTWRAAKHVDVVNNLSDTRDDAKDYIIKWAAYVAPLKLSSNVYVPQALFRFVKGNQDWFAEKRSRIKEFSLHAAVLRLRGSIDMDCFTDCITLLHSCGILGVASGETVRNNSITNRDGSSGSKKAEAEGKGTHGGTRGTGGTGDITSKDRTVAYEALKDTASEDITDKNRWAAREQDRVLDTEPIGNDNRIRDPTEESSYEYSEEYPQVLAIDEMGSFKKSQGSTQQSSHLHSCWRHVSERWPRLNYHGLESFGIACVIAAIAIFQGFPDDNIDRLIALNIAYCPNEDVQELTTRYWHSHDLVPKIEGIVMTRIKLHQIMWEATRETCEVWLTDAYRLPDGNRGTVLNAIDTSMDTGEWEFLWERIAADCA